MTLQIELDPELKARLEEQAARHGMASEAYALKLLEGSLPARIQLTGTGRLSPGDVDAMTRELTRGSENLPVLPPEANDRESYYEDRW